MITKTLNLDDAYQELFDEVREKSDGAIDVSNLDAFYGSIEEIAAVDPKFLRLPLDEPLFEIDANTRKITVPADFKSNGVSVQRDHLAEVIFFRVERYFDYTDLSTCNIVINWKMGNKEGKTTRFIKFEKVFTIDETKASCIVFGWPISEVVTEKSGTLTFAVEFFKTDGPEDDADVIYRFNTIPATINIKDGLIIDESIKAVNLDDDILRTLVNSSFGEGTAAVGDIKWLTGDGHGLVGGAALDAPGGTVISFNPADWQDTLNLDTVITSDGPQSIGINLIAQAFVDNGTVIRYTNSNGSDIQEAMVKVSENHIVVEDRNSLDDAKLYYVNNDGTEELATAEDKANADIVLYEVAPLNEQLMYYVQVPGSEPAVYSQASDEQLAAWGTVDEVELYSKLATISANKAGQYAIKAQGQKFDRNGVKIGSGETRSTDIVTVPAAVAPSAINIDVSAFTDELEEGYSFDESQMENVIFLNSQNQGTLTASADVDNFGALQFSWVKKVADADDFVPVSENAVSFKKENSDSLLITEPGEYKVGVVNFQNNTLAPATESAVITASPIAGKIISAPVKAQIGAGAVVPIPVNGRVQYNTSILSVSSVTLLVDVTEVEIDGVQGILECEWQKQVSSFDSDNIPVSTWETIEGATGTSLKITSNDGMYRPILKNNCKGSIYTLELSSVFVDDDAQ